MVALNFMKKIADDVEAGRKRISIRRERKDGKPQCKVGDALQLYTGMRTKSCRKLRNAICVNILPIWIEEAPDTVMIGWQPDDSATLFEEESLNNFARQDGFTDWQEMKKFIKTTHPVFYWLAYRMGLKR